MTEPNDNPKHTALEILAGTPTAQDARRFLAETDRSLLDIMRNGPISDEESVIYRGCNNEMGRRQAEFLARAAAGEGD